MNPTFSLFSEMRAALASAAVTRADMSAVNMRVAKAAAAYALAELFRLGGRNRAAKPADVAATCAAEFTTEQWKKKSSEGSPAYPVHCGLRLAAMLASGVRRHAYENAPTVSTIAAELRRMESQINGVTDWVSGFLASAGVNSLSDLKEYLAQPSEEKSEDQKFAAWLSAAMKKYRLEPLRLRAIAEAVRQEMSTHSAASASAALDAAQEADAAPAMETGT